MQWRTIGLLTGIPFTTMYSCFARWNRLGLWKGLVVDLLRRWRVACGDKSNPSVLVADSRSCRSSPTCGNRGSDGGKKVKGIKINILVDKHGFPLAVAISTANVHDCVGIIPALKEASTSGFRGKLLGDTAYQGENLKTTGQDLGIEVETKVWGAKGKFVPTEIRWVVERSFAWLSRYRRLNTIFDRTDASLIAFVLIPTADDQFHYPCRDAAEALPLIGTDHPQLVSHGIGSPVKNPTSLRSPPDRSRLSAPVTSGFAIFS